MHDIEGDIYTERENSKGFITLLRIFFFLNSFLIVL